MLLTIPSTIMDILFTFSLAFSEPTFENFIVLTIGAILTNGPRTITNMLRACGSVFARKHYTSYHNFLRRSKWSLFPLAKILCSLLFALIPGVIELTVDETLSRHRGKKVFAKSAHRDAVLSTHKRANYSFGHKWVVMCVRLRLPGITRAWSLPILTLLWINEKVGKKVMIKHRTPVALTIIMLKLLHKWFPHNEFILSGDGAYTALNRFCEKSPWVHLVSRLRMDAALYARPKKQAKSKRGRKPMKGKRLQSPQHVARNPNTAWEKTTVAWYGGVTKEILFFSQKALVYQIGQGVVEISWVLIRDPQGVLRDESFFTTDLSMSTEELIRHFVERWSIEVTFEEARKFLAIESTRNRKKESVTRSFPLLLGLFSIISFWYYHHLKEQPKPAIQEDWYHKTEPTFYDAMKAIRKELWEQSIFSTSSKKHNMVEIPRRYMTTIIDFLARAA